jgi:hypothetical protein
LVSRSKSATIRREEIGGIDAFLADHETSRDEDRLTKLLFETKEKKHRRA